jgi:glyoxylase-like metal-dependent hydrolase (beta-lactamase superfamily II)
VVTDGAATFPLPDKFVQNHPKAEVEQALTAAYQPVGTVTIPFTPIVINTGSKLVVIDTGYGPEMHVKTKGRVGQLPANLAAAGIDPKSVDTVIISHMHLDHVSGLRTADGGLTFPNAEVMVPTTDWAYWMSDVEMNKLPEGYTKSVYPGIRKTFAGLENKVTKYDWGKEIVPGITTVATPGHTPGHTSFVVASGSAKILVQSDVTNIPHLFLRHPTWQVMYDVDPLKAAETRKKFYDMASADKFMIQASIFRSRRPAMSRRQAANIGWCRSPGTRCSDTNCFPAPARGHFVTSERPFFTPPRAASGRDRKRGSALKIARRSVEVQCSWTAVGTMSVPGT